jgi:hypothetical protein
MMKKAIVEKVYWEDHVSFVQIERMFEEQHFDYKGSRVIHHEKCPHLIIWAGWNEKAVKTLEEIMLENDICLQTTHKLVYLIDGGGVNIPIAKGIKTYKRDHWLPMVLRPEAKCGKNK